MLPGFKSNPTKIQLNTNQRDSANLRDSNTIRMVNAFKFAVLKKKVNDKDSEYCDEHKG